MFWRYSVQELSCQRDFVSDTFNSSAAELARQADITAMCSSHGKTRKKHDGIHLALRPNLCPFASGFWLVGYGWLSSDHSQENNCRLWDSWEVEVISPVYLNLLTDNILNVEISSLICMIHIIWRNFSKLSSWIIFISFDVSAASPASPASPGLLGSWPRPIQWKHSWLQMSSARLDHQRTQGAQGLLKRAQAPAKKQWYL